MLPLYDDVENESLPIVNLLLIAANIVIFVWSCGLAHTIFSSFGPWALLLSLPSDAVLQQHAVIPINIVEHCHWPQLQTLFTAMFLHAGIWHLLGNMWFLWIFGD